MNMNLDNLISSQFELDKFNTDKERIKVLQEKIDDMQEVVNSMQALQGRLRQSIYEDWQKATKELFPELHPCERGALTDVSLTLEGKRWTSLSAVIPKCTAKLSFLLLCRKKSEI